MRIMFGAPKDTNETTSGEGDQLAVKVVLFPGKATQEANPGDGWEGGDSIWSNSQENQPITVSAPSEVKQEANPGDGWEGGGSIWSNPQESHS